MTVDWNGSRHEDCRPCMMQEVVFTRHLWVFHPEEPWQISFNWLLDSCFDHNEQKFIKGQQHTFLAIFHNHFMQIVQMARSVATLRRLVSPSVAWCAVRIYGCGEVVQFIMHTIAYPLVTYGDGSKLVKLQSDWGNKHPLTSINQLLSMLFWAPRVLGF